VKAPTPTTILSRVGGEEFLALMPCCDTWQAANYADELRTAIEEKQIKHEYSQCSEFITISVGVAGQIPLPNQKPVELIDIADKALYQAKEAGRNYVSLAE
ncbi:GGDEF domain-containing protein, partial [Vibrio makurazakiensis]|uniref:GGDEF domain-containing protein n=1 Tax=Vibrio makurazakiensis TaxID=2910250 RepID=UPI003D0CE84F